MKPTEIWVNDVHSGLNPTRVNRVIVPKSVEDLAAAVRSAAEFQLPVSIAGGRHAMGGQQFVSEGVLIDLRGLNGIISLDRDRGHLRCQAGIQWPDLISSYLSIQSTDASPWGIAQKQTGADALTLGGSISANAHGRGLTLRPMIQDVECFTLMQADGTLLACSRVTNAELFSLAIGGYGLFGIITDVTLRLVPRIALERIVEMVTSEELSDLFSQRIAAGFVYGDFQFSIDESSSDFLQRGVFSCYRPTEKKVPANQPRELEGNNWLKLLHLAYTNRAQAFAEYEAYYLSTNGQVYWSDLHQLSPYLPDYAQRILELDAGKQTSSLMITEVYVPGQQLAEFLREAAQDLKARGVTVIYGTVRLIEKDHESFLAWARDSFACIIVNLLVEHTPVAQARAAEAFRSLIDLAASKQGSYYLTYHRYASNAQVERAYPQFRRFLSFKTAYDPEHRFQSDWFRHYRKCP